MELSVAKNPPKRVTDLIHLKQQGMDLSISLSFEVVPVDFAHENAAFQAYIFLCRYSGTVNGNEFMFRKCYAKGCQHNLCPHVAQAVMIANRYLQRDYKKMKDAGIAIEEKFFSLEEMIVKFKDDSEEASHTKDGVLTIHDYINIAKEGNKVEVKVNLDAIPAVEHFANKKNKQTFLMGNFAISTLGSNGEFQRCLACYQTDQEELKPDAVSTANERLKNLYSEFGEAGIACQPQFF
ncbi:conserved hypothetical protein [Desulfamplus magnetovallimortis]|uniref:Uncharacterized protein n=1 Tax=Desulfamplus magnetovallimortis TaxID=1246637 RepID=A0A1W1H6G5_9BACT|nr:hypothetical protein [Desulfamplus magnetovallimortis]SLM28052.1 conserved hypothetical protein [Desulfamplus magnetovallimortis]